MSVDVKLLTTEVERLANLYPNAVYKRESVGTSCKYTRGEVINSDNGEVVGCGCIIGQAILNLYPGLRDQLESVDRFAALSVTDLLYRLTYTNAESQADIDYLMEIQNKQDREASWGECINNN